MKPFSATLISYLHTCHRKLWLHTNEIRMEHTSEVVADGRFIGETSYGTRAAKYRQVELPGIKIDFYDPVEGVVHEVKRTASIEAAHEAQVRYYLYVLEQHQLPAHYGVLDYPRQRHKVRVEYTEADRTLIQQWIEDIERILQSDTCPPVLLKPICKKCSYYDFCYSTEVPES